MSDQSLRDALEKVLATTEGWAVSNETLLGLLAAHPAETAPRPLLDREAAMRAIESVSSHSDIILGREHVEAYSDEFADAVMELARPMPTIDEVAYALFEHDSETTGRATPWGELGAIMKATYLDRGEALLALLNRAEA